MKWIALGDGKESPLTDGQLSDLEKVRDYAQDHSTCRRVRILQHFGDNSFDPITCNRNCDNCFNPQHTQTDVTHYAKELVLLLQSGQRERTRFTVLKLVDHYTNKGPRSQSTSRMGSRNEQAVTKDFLLDIVAQLVTLKVFELNRVPGHSKHFLYLQMGRAAPRLSNGTLLIYIYFHESHVAATATTKARKRKADDRV
ncbi:hypothetical protein CALVIDRAFT_142536 [Calocera viscosa TUFC12733]|uniref:ATP-dependent DNA helicase RecQ zinc-binding domain-containing protein n=1 Tax=Calocera viscosa (strain TUFC12733) TaxID=1330018 RepID=A0A167LQQ7_CALVF|nr:hypothetical protein CALVIDRAFT_142536 [Calocera viscosa TUFC12733]